MNFTLLNKTDSKKTFLLSLLLLQIVWVASIFLDLALMREVLGFIYLTFVPGYIVIQLLSLKKLDTIETLILSVGLSIAFLMFAGLCLNHLAAALKLPQPLSLVPLSVLITSTVLVGGILYLLKKETDELPSLSVPSRPPLFSLIFVILPILAIVGALYVNVYESNLILLITLVLIAVVMGISVLSKRIVPPKYYVVVLLAVAIALLLHSSLISSYVYGNDIQLESYLAKTTRLNGYWDSTMFGTDLEYGRYNAMLSITVLPTVYTVLLGASETVVFKVVFPLLFSIVPVVLYKTLEKKLDKKIALISAFLLISQTTFFTEMLGLARQMIAELFFILLFFILLNDRLDNRTKKVCFIVFSFGLIVSHYSLSLIFVFFMAAIWGFNYFTKKRSNSLTLSLIILFLVLMFSWYIFSSGSASFESMQVFGNRIYSSLGDFFNPQSRGSLVVRGLGLEAADSIWQTLSRGVAYATEVLIVIGFISTYFEWKKNNKHQDFVLFMFSGMILLALVIIVPRFASALNMTRFYHIILFSVSPLFALGGLAIFKYVFKQRKQIFSIALIVAILVPYFLFQTGFVYEVTGSESWSVPLSHYRMDEVTLYQSSGFIVTRDVYGAQWFSQNIDTTNITVYSDSVSRYKVMTSYAMMYAGSIVVITNWTEINSQSVVYLSTLNVEYEKIVGGSYVWNYSDIRPKFETMNKLYSNGGCEIYQTPNK